MARTKASQAPKRAEARKTLEKAHTNVQLRRANDYGTPDNMLNEAMHDKHKELKKLYREATREARKGK